MATIKKLMRFQSSNIKLTEHSNDRSRSHIRQAKRRKEKGRQVKVHNTLFVRSIVKLRMWYADFRGHHGKRWNYEPSDHYMGMSKRKKPATK